MRAVQRRMREAELKLQEVQRATAAAVQDAVATIQGGTVAALQDAVAAIRRTHDEMGTLFQYEPDDIG